MSEKKKRKTHTAEFKAKVGLEALKEMNTINEIGQEYGVLRCKNRLPHCCEECDL